jgi:hypothetical protein
MLEYGAIIGILVLVGGWVFHPLFRPKPLESFSSLGAGDREKRLQQAKEDVYEAIKEMDFDYGMGKISENDYQELRSQYKTKAVEILKELAVKDTREDAGTAIETEVRELREREEGDDTDTLIEREVEALRTKKGPKEDRGIGGEDETGWKVNFCPQCGRKVLENDKFCQDCGIKLIVVGRSN